VYLYGADYRQLIWQTVELSNRGFISKIFAGDFIKLDSFMKMFYCVRPKHKYLFFGRFFLKLYNTLILAIRQAMYV